MPCDYTIDAEHQLVSSRAWGDVSDAELLDHQRRLADDSTFHRDMSQLWDFRATTCTDAVTADGLRKGAQRHLFGPRSRRAIVVANDTNFGLARMFETFRDLAGGKDRIRIFRSMDDARTWMMCKDDPV